MQNLVASLSVAFALLLGVWVVVSPWVIFLKGGWRLLLRCYLLPYPLVVLSFALIMAFVNRRELLTRVRNWRAKRKTEKLREMPGQMYAWTEKATAMRESTRRHRLAQSTRKMWRTSGFGLREESVSAIEICANHVVKAARGV